MKRVLTRMALLCILMLPFGAKAQYSIIPIAPPPTFSFNDLWHFTITGPSASSHGTFYVSLRIFDGSNVLKAKSNTSTFQLGQGSSYYNLSNIHSLQPFITSYYSAPLLEQAISSGGNFPPGTYHLVYTLYGKFDDGEFTPLSEDVSQAIVEALWPPMLLFPPDGDTIDTQYPMLAWTPAFAGHYGGQITYTLNLVELLSGQNPYQAIQANPLYFTQHHIPVTILPYPPGAQILDTSKTYAWQVHADANGTSLGSSEVWTFTFGTPKDSTVNNDTSFVLFHDLEPEYPSKFVIMSDKKILFKYIHAYNQDSDISLRFKLYREGVSLPLLTSEQCQSCMLLSQDVYYTIDLEELEAFTPGFYLLRIFDHTGHPKYLRVLYHESNE